MAKPNEYGLERNAEFEHPEHGQVEVVSEGEWPVTVIKPREQSEPEYFDIFEFEAEEMKIDL
jgi:hypothetical protein